MKINLNSIKVKDIFKGFKDNGEDGVFAYDEKLAIKTSLSERIRL